MQISYTSLQTGNHASTALLNFYRQDALPDANQQCQITLGIRTEDGHYKRMHLVALDLLT